MSFSARIIAGLGWTAGGRFLGQLVAWGVSIVVIRILNPEDYGLLAMAGVLTGFVALFSELGLGWAVVHAREVDTPTLRRVFGLVIAVNGGLTLLLFAVAPLVAAYFGEARLTEIIRVMAIQFLIVAPGVIPDSMLQRDLEFKWRALVELSATIAGGASTLGLALTGFGVWSLVYGSLLAVAWRTVGINLVHPFLHLPRLSFTGMKELFAFGGYVAVSRLFQYLYLQADVIIGGRILGKEQIGYYSVGMHLASLPMQRISAILNEVAFPAFARIQDERERVGGYLLQSIRLMSLFAFSVFWGIAAVAPEIVSVLLGAKWAPAILPLQLLALVMPVRMIGQLMPPTLQGVGKANLVVRNQLLACIVMTAAFLVGVQFGIIGLSFAWVVAFPVVFLANLTTWLSVLGLRAGQLLGAMMRPAIAGAGMFAAVAAIRALGIAGGPYALPLFILAGAASYVLLSLAINREGINEVRSLFRRGRPTPE
jgi:O-antigen/teichoic acid export membrane protein